MYTEQAKSISPSPQNGKPMPYHIEAANKVAKEFINTGLPALEVVEFIKELKNILCQTIVDKMDTARNEADRNAKELEIIRES